MQKTHFTARKNILFESLSTQSLITSTKTLYLLHFLMQSADISFFKLVFTFFSFAFELPSGYFSDRYGNRRAVLLSRILIASSMLFYCVLPSFAGFLTANLLLGVADAWESGAKDSYFLKQCLLQKLDYQELKVRAAKYTYAVNFFLALVLEMLFCTTCTSILISNFDFFSMIFESAGISVSMIGAIYASFGAVYGGFAAVTLCATCIYLRRTLVKDKS